MTIGATFVVPRLMAIQPTPAPGARAPLLSAQGLRVVVHGQVLHEALTFDIGPGLTLVRGGEGRGKTTLLRLLAGLQAPTAGTLQRRTDSIWYPDLTSPADDAVAARDWLARQRAGFPAWRDEVQDALVDAFALQPHVDKPLYMLSTGSRRKVGLVGAAASGAALTLLDTPFAALDAPSRQVLAELLEDAADGDRAWVLADHEPPPQLRGVTLAGPVDLGD